MVILRLSVVFLKCKCVEKWSGVAEIGRGIKNMPTKTARNLAILLENQARAMSRMSEAQLGWTTIAGTSRL